MSKRIPDAEWLHFAKRVAIGAQQRVRHGNERDPAMVVGNQPDRWWCWCQRCKCGAVVRKEHALTVAVAPHIERNLTVPNDITMMAALQGYQRDHVAGLLASKGMDLIYLPMLTGWSESRGRIMVPTHNQEGYMGRDTTGRSAQKWLTYNGQHYVQAGGFGPVAVLTEDLFSAHKVAWAMKEFGVSTYCTLGTSMHEALLAEILKCPINQVISFYDGDAAGHKGAAANEQRLQPFGLASGHTPAKSCAPRGLDPKDMSLQEIQQHLFLLGVNRL